MFGFLKDKLKGALGKLTKEVEKDAVVEKKEVLVEKKESEKKQPTQPKSAKAEESKAQAPKVEAKKPGFFQKLFSKKEDEDIIEEKEELREKAEKTIIEPAIEEKKDATHIKRQGYQIEEKEKPQKPSKIITKAISIKGNAADKEEKKKSEQKYQPEIPEIKKEHIPEPIRTAKEVHDSKTEIKHTEQISAMQQDTGKEDKGKDLPKEAKKPHFEAVEEERSTKTVEKDEEHKGFFQKITETFTKIQISDEKFEELFWELEVVLLENNVAVEVIDKIKRDLKKELMSGKVSRKGVDELILSTLRQSIEDLFNVEKIDLIHNIREKKKAGQPYIISIIGVNGSGKTTSIAKLTHKFQKEGLTVVLAASDTFRAAAIQQLEEHANKLNVKMVKHDYNSDPAAVAFDAIKYAEAKGVDVVLIDTAGRLHSNTNLMRELEKVIRVCKPDIKIFVGESITGNDCVEQAKEFDKAVGIDAIILAKADVDDKGGAAISVSYILQRPILYLGTGQTYDDLKDFDPHMIIESLEL